MFFKRKVFKNFCNIHRKTPVLDSLCSKVASLEACKFINKRLQHKCFPMNIANFLRTAFFMEHLWQLLFKVMFETCQNFTMKNKTSVKPVEKDYVNVNDHRVESCDNVAINQKTQGPSIYIYIYIYTVIHIHIPLYIHMQ